MGASVYTGGHLIYTSPRDQIQAEDLRPGSRVLAVQDDSICYVPVLSFRPLPSRLHMYDLTVEDHHNFVVGRGSAGVTVKNCADRNYHFRPPEAEANIGAYNRVFGQIWRDEELAEFLEQGLDWWNMFPPATEDLKTIDMLVRDKPAWRTAILWQAIVGACFALEANWVADEFSLVGETKVRVWARGGLRFDLPIADLYEMLLEGADSSLFPADRARLRRAYREGSLMALSADPETATLVYRPITNVMRHTTPHKELVRVVLNDKRQVTCTVDHSLFMMSDVTGKFSLAPIAGSEIRPGFHLVTLDNNRVQGVEVMAVETLPPAHFTYDLSVPGPQNFMLSNGVLAHNSYSIGGISLDLEKSSKYESLRSGAEQQFDKATEAKARTVRFLRGLSQPRFGTGVRSAFGPAVGRGVLSPRNFV